MIQDEIERLRTALQIIADERCECGGQFKQETTGQVRCENCDRHKGYGYGMAVEIAKEALENKLIGRPEVWEEERRGAGY